jgi:cell division ATPase FtsA
MVVHENGVLRFVRILLMGGEDVTSTLVRVMELDRDAAERAKLAASAGGDDADPRPASWSPSASRCSPRRSVARSTSTAPSRTPSR